MTAPRPILPKTYWLISRSTAEGQCLLRPDEPSNQLFQYAVAEAAQRYKIELLAVTVMSSQYDAVVYDTDGRLPFFLAHFHKLLAHLINAREGRDGPFWDAKEPTRVELVDMEDVLEAVMGTLATPVQAHLVERAQDWPGSLTRSMWGGPPEKVERPELYFGAKTGMPGVAEFKTSVPPTFRGSKGAWAALVERRLDARERAIGLEREAARIKCVGATRALTSAATPSAAHRAPARGFVPVLNAATAELRLRAAKALKRFRWLYRRAFEAFRSGSRDAIFPPGTFQMRHRCGVVCAQN
ncbi:MAG: hypothetical protein U0414_36735 [Polyangiaceae bacterium]